ncbi:DUF1127 domain-containing protein [Aliisedimentitalea scapharcae]|uniref:DUF1127 domain-containing protein n=1 Tax=Aliisedimentitalea scapharcae TaxID=1524259 RepID=A0ABZ2XMZ1_9RHOB|nr:DUF1127 domain-containing protein [Rhodobacteraceae bacterium M382]
MTNTAHIASPHMAYLNSRPALPVLAQWAVGFAVLVTKWTLRQRTRKHLRHLTPEQLQDIGLTRAEAHYQATLPFWRP